MNMLLTRYTRLLTAVALSTVCGESWAIDSYRFLHVTIETPWYIFLFLLAIFFVPFILMGVLVWRYAEKRKEHGAGNEGEPQ